MATATCSAISWQRPWSANLRLNWIFTPTMSIEVFAQPLVSSVHYERVLQLARPSRLDWCPTGDRPGKYSFTFSSDSLERGLPLGVPPLARRCSWSGTENQSVEEKNGLFQVSRSLDSLGRDPRRPHLHGQGDVLVEPLNQSLMASSSMSKTSVPEGVPALALSP
jgi:hypothetical protein